MGKERTAQAASSVKAPRRRAARLHALGCGMTRKSNETTATSASLATKPERQRWPDQLDQWEGGTRDMRGTSGAASPGSSAACIAQAAAQAVRGTQIESSP